jgi:cell wall-associated NlpC family hydrolase
MVVALTALAITLSAAPAAHATPSTADLTKQIDKASSQLEVVVESYNAMNISLKKTLDDEKKLAASLAPAKAALVTATAQVNTIAATSYREGRIGPVSALLSGGTQSDLMDRIGILDQLQRSNRRDIDNYTTTTQTFTQRQTALKQTQAKQQAQVKELNARKTKIQASITKLKAMRTAAYGRPTESGTKGAAGSPPALSGAAGKAVDYAYAAANRAASYGYGDSGPNSYDCSGLTMAAWAAAGYSLPHNAAAQWGVVAHISRASLRGGDLVFYNSLAHVGIYVGNDKIIDAPTYGKPVAVRSINRGMPIYGYGRVT